MSALLLLVAGAGTTHAQPLVRVRAETRIELRVERGEGAIMVHTTLRDDRGEALPGRPIEVRLASATGIPLGTGSGLTDNDGKVSAPFTVEPGAYRITATFPGEERHLGVEVSQNLDLLRAHVRLGMSLDSEGRLDRLDLDRPEHRIRVRADSDEGGGGLSIELADELSQRLASGVTDDDGMVMLTVDSHRLGPPAAGRLIVSTAGDERRAPAQTEVLVVRFRTTTLELTADRTHLDAEETLHVEGRLADSQEPLGRKAVGLFAGEAHLATVLTDDDGRFARDLELPTAAREDDDDPANEVIELTARFVSDAPWRPSARSEPLRVEVDVPTGTSYFWVILTVLVSAIAFVLLSRRGRTSPAPAVDGERASVPAPPGFVPSAPRARLSDRRDVGGLVLDADEGTPLHGVTIRLLGEDGPVSQTDVSGRFRFEVARDGRYTVRAEQAGYARCETAIEIPHRGEWSNLEVRITSLREVVLRAYRPVAEALAPDRKWWGFWTLGELVRRAQPAVRPPVTALSEAVENVAYGGAVADPDHVDAIVREAADIARALKEKPPTVPPPPPER